MSEKQETLLSCPFCDSPAEHESTVTQETVRCTLCPATMSYDGSGAAVKAMWNGRQVSRGEWHMHEGKERRMKHEEMLSIPLHDGTRLKIGECFTVLDEYPFFSEGKENYNAELCWDDNGKMLFYDIYPVSDRVRGGACGGSIGQDELDWSKICRRPKNENK
jgi:hypothetical protein